ncbi:MAG: PDDEXK nuclease domain-containing protein [Chitinophagaceae bacterium]
MILETAIINRLEHFMLELGKGFLFEGRQRRFTFEGDSFFVDLVFYNRLLKCFVLFDLKMGKLTHQDIGQMQMYVNYYNRKIKSQEENPTIGIILCKEENRTVVEFTLPEDNNTIFAKEYKAVLPSKEALKKQLK